MSSIVIAGDTSGSVTIAAPAIAGTTVITLPATTGTLLASGGALGTPSSGTLTSCTGLPLTTGITGTLPIANGGTNSTATAYCSLTTNISGTLPVANGGTGVTTSTGSGATVLGTSPTLVTPALGTPASGVLTNCTGVAKAALPAGCVLQVVQATSTTLTATTSATYADATGFTATITPISASSKILVMCDISFYIQSDNATIGGVQIVRGATAIHTDNNYAKDNVNANVALGAHGAFNYLDSPATTSATTYKIQIKRTSTAGTSYAFRINDIAGTNISSITLIEVAG